MYRREGLPVILVFFKPEDGAVCPSENLLSTYRTPWRHKAKDPNMDIKPVFIRNVPRYDTICRCWPCFESLVVLSL